MISLQEIVRHHAPLLVIDTASMQVQVGVFRRDQPPRWAEETDEAGIAIFRCIDRLGINPADIEAFAFCNGPGSTLGIRTAAMSIRTWTALAPRPVFQFGSLSLLVHSLGRNGVGAIADARRDSWHCQFLDAPLQRIPTPGLTGDLVTPENFRFWSARPDFVKTTPYRVESMFNAVPSAAIFEAAPEPDAFLHEPPAYATWTPHIHRSPNP